MTDHAQSASACPASREALWDLDEFECPICGRPAEEHPPEPPQTDAEYDERDGHA